jgi:hypothetical protein
MERQTYNHTGNPVLFIIAIGVMLAISFGFAMFAGSENTRIASDTTTSAPAHDTPAAEKFEPEK